MTHAGRLIQRAFGRRSLEALAASGATAAVLTYVPAALAFPHQMQIGRTTIYADRPIPAVIAQRLARADALLAQCPLDDPSLPRTLVLTNGGWRWRVMAAGHAGAVALRRPFAHVLLFNHTDVAADRVTNGAGIGGTRTLSGTIAHEMVHVLTARRYGEIALARLPAWKREGYADHVAGETSIGGAVDEAQIRARYPDAGVLIYYAGRRRVAAILARNGGSVDRLMAQ
ncbi:hypothetical protein [Sphingomonas mucosissima]|uniref:Peptidase MA superfamily protein n=1 Tax=Sphingomonas mucosissima TaxID=370959 RepID=A0A245ZFZ3_9SPHN|nr:hypothetical protein [Sphingomonas mucosissima]OWK28655.1 hypothetical protein SPMU_29180 [Sphingomonas mucosissima]